MYCVNCGVKLADSEQVCPLCGVRACHPELPRQAGEPMFPARRYPAPQLPTHTTQIIVTTLFLLPLFITLLCDLQINRAVTWSGYVAGALLVAYVMFVLPYWFRRPEPAVFVPMSFLSIGIYVFYINQAAGGRWFVPFALPVVAYVGAVLTIVTVLLRFSRLGRLWIFGGAFLALGAFMPLMEHLICTTFQRRFVAWSLYPMIALVLLGATLLILAGSPKTREPLERKFFL